MNKICTHFAVKKSDDNELAIFVWILGIQIDKNYAQYSSGSVNKSTISKKFQKHLRWLPNCISFYDSFMYREQKVTAYESVKLYICKR